MKRVLYVNPFGAEQNGFSSPPLGLLSLAGILLKQSFDKVRRRVAEIAYVIRINFPVIVSIETTSHCNARCVMCPHSVMPRRNNQMETAIFNIIYQQLGGLKVKLVVLSLIGEPLLDRKIAERIKQLSGLGYRTRIVTNASLLTRDMSRDLISAGLSELYVSLNGYNEKSHQEMMRFASPQFNKCVENLVFFSETSGGRIKMHLNCLAYADIDLDIKLKFTAFWREKGIKVNLAKPVDWHRPCKKKQGNVYPCRVIFSNLVIDCMGNVLSCCRDYRSTVIMGNVLENSLREIWKGSSFQQFRFKHLQGLADSVPICATCEINKSISLLGVLKSFVMREE